MLPRTQHPDNLHFRPGAAPRENFVVDRNAFVVDVESYDRTRSMLYALGAKSVANKMMANVDLIVHGGGKAPAKAIAKYPKGRFIRAQEVLPLFHQEVPDFAAYVRALQGHGFTVRNPSDEGDPSLDFFTVPLLEGSIHASLLEYLKTSDFVRAFAHAQSFPIDTREESYLEFEVPGGRGITWYIRWLSDAWARVSAQRGEGDYPLEIKGPQLMAIAPIFWTESAGLWFNEYPHVDSVDGLFIQAGVDARTGMVHGAAISRVWT
ncbi:MAG: hypothetical protein R3B09_02160 [Nannocystaceae bacterium]